MVACFFNSAADPAIQAFCCFQRGRQLCRLLKFVKDVGLPDTEKPKFNAGSTKSRVRSTVMRAGQQAIDDKWDERAELPEGTAGRASREPAHRDTAAHERQKDRSRSPVARQPIPKRDARVGQHVLFTDAIRRVEGSAPEPVQKQPVSIKQEPDSSDVVMLDSSGQEIKQEAAAQERTTRSNPTGTDARRSTVQPGAAADGTVDQLQLSPTPEDYDGTSVVITNVHFEATPEQVGIFFHKRCGGVMRVTILKNAHGMPKGVDGHISSLPLMNGNNTSRNSTPPGAGRGWGTHVSLTQSANLNAKNRAASCCAS